MCIISPQKNGLQKCALSNTSNMATDMIFIPNENLSDMTFGANS